LCSVGSDSDESFSDSQEEEDQQMWEEQQIGKGVKRHQVRPDTVTDFNNLKPFWIVFNLILTVWIIFNLILTSIVFQGPFLVFSEGLAGS